MLDKIYYFILTFCIVESIFYFIFYFLQIKLSKSKKISLISIGKGLLERVLIFGGLVNDLASILIYFGAVKISTRLRDDNTENISNDYFLIGNMVSVCCALLMYIIYKYNVI